jgi:ribonuclease R
MKDRILEILKKEERAYSIETLSNLLEINDVNEQKELESTLRTMQKEYDVFVTNKNNYMLPKFANLFKGEVKGNRQGGFAHVDIEGDIDVYVKGSNLNGALHGDIVLVKVFGEFGPKMAGEILEIIQKSNKPQVGEVILDGSDIYVKLEDSLMGIRVKIDPKKTMNAMTGHMVAVELKKQLHGNLYLGEITKIIGHRNDPWIDIKTIQVQFGINNEFPKEVLDELDNIPNEIDVNDIPNRRDLRHLKIITIDGADAKDLDDAISGYRLSEDEIVAQIHIADVAHYVKWDSAIFKEAVNRATSVYNVDSVVPMLPHKLSNGICSLNGNVDRFAITTEMVVDKKGEIKSVDIYRSVINSKMRMTYDAVNDYSEKGIVQPGYENFTEELSLYKEFADIFRNRRQRDGAIDFELDEAKILVDEKGFPIDVIKRYRGVGEKLIEDFMVTSNAGVGTKFYDNYPQLPCIYRVHGIPSEEKVKLFTEFLSLLGLTTTGKIKVEHAKSLQILLDKFKSEDIFPIISAELLKSMRKAVYDTNNIGHYALALKKYVHSTSPIRRLPDLLVQMLIEDIIFNNNYDEATLNKWEARLKSLAEHASIKERNAVDCEREVEKMKKAEYMTTQIGKEFEGIITSAVNFGFFVQLPNLIEGLVSVETLVEDTKQQWEYSQSAYAITSDSNKRGYRIGDKVKVLVKGASKEKRQVDFKLVK